MKPETTAVPFQPVDTRVFSSPARTPDYYRLAYRCGNCMSRFTVVVLYGRTRPTLTCCIHCGVEDSHSLIGRERG